MTNSCVVGHRPLLLPLSRQMSSLSAASDVRGGISARFFGSISGQLKLSSSGERYQIKGRKILLRSGFAETATSDFSSQSSSERFTKVSFSNQFKLRPSWKQHHIEERRMISRSGLAGTASSSDFSPQPSSGLPLISRVRGLCFYAMTGATAIILFLAMIVAHPFVLLFDRYQRKAQHLIAKIWASLTVFPFYRVEFQGVENLPPKDVPAVYVSNHQSFLDIYTVLTLGKSFKFISKRSIFLIPIIGWAMFLLGTIPIRRMDTKSQLECLKRCIYLVEKGASVYFFPEGTRSKDGKLGAFKKGAFTVASKTGAPVVPITIMGTGALMPSGMEGFVNSGDVKVVIHKPLKGSNAENLMNDARSMIADTLLLHGYGVH